MNNLLRDIKERRPSKRKTNSFGKSISKLFSIKESFKKKRCVIERICRGPLFVNCQKQLTYLVYGKYLAQTFGSLSLSKIRFPFQKAISTRYIIRVNGEDKSIICCTCLGKMLFYNN